MSAITSALLWLCASVGAALLARTLLLLGAIRARRRRIVARQMRAAPLACDAPPPPPPPHGVVLVVLGSGGHTAEMLSLLSELQPLQRAMRVVYVLGDSDAHSRRKAATAAHARTRTFCVIPRAREVAQPLRSSVLSVARAMVAALRLVWMERPVLVLCNGPANAAVVALAAFVLRVLARCEARVVFVESFARVRSLSVSGRVLLPFVDRFIVQWPQLKRRYALSEYYGRLC